MPTALHLFRQAFSCACLVRFITDERGVEGGVPDTNRALLAVTC